MLRRRTSSTGSLRRSSVSARDIEAIQRALQKQRTVSNQVLSVLVVLLPIASLFYAQLIYANAGVLWKTVSPLARPPFLLSIVPPLFDVVAWKCLVFIVLIQLIFYWFLPQDSVVVLSTSIGDHRKSVNGFSSFLLMLLLYPLGAALKLYRPDLLFLHLHSILGCLALLALATMAVLHFSYRFGEHNTIDSLSEFFFGVEVYPTVADIDLKHFIRTRITLVLWALYSISALFHQKYELGRIETTALCLCAVQLVYVFKCFWNEDLMLNSLDSRRAKCGFYRIWGDMVFFPALYCSPIASVVQLNCRLSILGCSLLSVLCLVAIALVALVDRQRHNFRRHKGLMKISGRDPFFILAKYRTETGDAAANLLLGSGYWGFSRHPNYVCEVVIFLCFSLFQGIKPQLYFPFFFILFYLIARTLNDENRCLLKYGSYWMQYCQRVPFRFLPGI